MSTNPPKQHVSFYFRHPETGRVNKPQCNFYDKVMLAIASHNLFRFFFYGGAIRGGKTFVCLYIFVVLARMFPRSRWHVFRSDFPELEDTTIPSMEKLIGVEGKDFVWKRKASNYHVHFKNGSKIFFKSENLARDPELTWMLGLETNGIMLEQMEGLSEKLLDRSIERIGSWYIPNMPPPVLFGTLNPTDKWPKQKLYDKHILGTLPANWHFQEALPEDNPSVTAEQWENWKNLDPISYDQMIKGIWKFLNDAKLFAYSFMKEKHVVDVSTPEGKALMEPKRNFPLKLYFDFNVDPMTCIVTQNDGLRWFKIIAEYRLRNSDIYELLARIKSDWDGWYIHASGDASGRNRQAITKGKRSYVFVIQKELKLGDKQMKFPMKNPSVANTRIVLNSLFHRHPAFMISSACQFTVLDLESVKVNDEGDIDKKKDSLKTHFLDNVRYFVWQEGKGFVTAIS